ERSNGRVGSAARARQILWGASTAAVLSSGGKAPMSIRAASRTAAEKLLGHLASECDTDCVSRTAPNDVPYYYGLPAIFAYGGRCEYWAIVFHISGLIRHKPLLRGGWLPSNTNTGLAAAAPTQGES